MTECVEHSFTASSMRCCFVGLANYIHFYTMIVAILSILMPDFVAITKCLLLLRPRELFGREAAALQAPPVLH